MTKKNVPTLIAAGVLVLILLLYMVIYQVRFTETVVVTTFGKPSTPKTDARNRMRRGGAKPVAANMKGTGTSPKKASQRVQGGDLERVRDVERHHHDQERDREIQREAEVEDDRGQGNEQQGQDHDHGEPDGDLAARARARGGVGRSVGGRYHARAFERSSR